MRFLDFDNPVLLALPLLAALLACEGGANQNQKTVGDEPGGVKVGLGDIAVSPQGGYVVFRRAQGLAVGWAASGVVETLPVQLPTRLAFSKQRPVVYVGTESGDLRAVNVESRSELWRAPIDSESAGDLRLESSADDRFVLASNPRELRVFDAGNGKQRMSRHFEQGIADLELLPDSRRALVIEGHSWVGDQPTTRISIIDLETSSATAISVPNCAADLKVTRDGARAFLAPTHCQKDPVSLIDLSAGFERFERNLPGFGPVSIAPDGSTAVAFYDVEQGDVALFDDPAQMPSPDTERYHLMLIDTLTMSYEFAAVGSALPRYALTPDGSVLLVDTSLAVNESARLYDVRGRSFKSLSGPTVSLQNFVISSDSAHAYGLYAGLFDIDLDAARTEVIETGFDPVNLNISADDRTLYLRKSDSSICIFDLGARRCRGYFNPAAVLEH